MAGAETMATIGIREAEVATRSYSHKLLQSPIFATAAKSNYRHGHGRRMRVANVTAKQVTALSKLHQLLLCSQRDVEVSVQVCGCKLYWKLYLV